MEKQKNNPARTVLLVFAIIFSIVLVPGLIAGIPAGGALLAASSAVSREEVSELLQEKNVSETLRELVLKRANIGEKVEEVNPEYFNKVLEEVVSTEFVDSIIEEFLTSAYQGTKPQVDVAPVIEQFKVSIQELADNGFEDLYAVWENGTTSKYFSDAFVQDFINNIESDLLSEYSGYGAASVEELEKIYDGRHGEGDFKELLRKKMKSFREEWEVEFNAKYESEVEKMTANLESKVNDAIYEATSNPELRDVFDSIQEISEQQDTVKIVVYAIIIGAVVFLVLLYWLGVAGFVVTSIPVLLGGLLCKLISLAGEPFVALVKQELGDKAGEEAVMLVYDVVEGLVGKVFALVGQFGTTMLIFGVILIGLAIFRGVLKKNAAEAV